MALQTQQRVGGRFQESMSKTVHEGTEQLDKDLRSTTEEDVEISPAPQTQKTTSRRSTRKGVELSFKRTQCLEKLVKLHLTVCACVVNVFMEEI